MTAILAFVWAPGSELCLLFREHRACFVLFIFIGLICFIFLVFFTPLASHASQRQ
jgi:hypothetical protein